MTTANLRQRLIGGAAFAGLLLAGAAHAQVQQTPAADDITKVEEVVVVGSQIKGAKTTAALPVTMMDNTQIAATGAVSGDDLFRSIPIMGDVFINPSNAAQTSNSTRGDVNSINLRSLGVGNTLVLLNGRRLVSHPTSQSSGTVPLLGYNANAIPTANLERLEILRDGAAAIYGADAVAGVVNTVLQTDFNGLTMDAQYGWAEGTHRKEYTGNIFGGTDFADGRGNVSINANFTERTAQRPSDRPYTATQDLRPLFDNDPLYGDSAAPDNRGNQNSFSNITVLNAGGVVRQGATALTTAAGATHVQPNTVTGCAAQLGNGLCLGTGNLATGGAANFLRYNAPQNDATTIAPKISRQNVFLNGHYDITDTLTAYGEIGLYHAQSEGLTTQGTSLVAIGVPASNYYNPFGMAVFANGAVNPNRLPNLTNVPAAGRAVTFTNYRFNDLGPNKVEVENYQTRFLGGLKGEKFGWDWDSALLYSKADAKDESDGIDSEAGRPVGPVDPRRLQPLQRRVPGRGGRPRLHAQLQGGDRRHSLPPQAPLDHHPDPGRLQGLQARPADDLVRPGRRRRRRRVPPRDPAGPPRPDAGRPHALHRSGDRRHQQQQRHRRQRHPQHQGLARRHVGLRRTGPAAGLAGNEHPAGARYRRATGRSLRELQRLRIGGQTQDRLRLGPGRRRAGARFVATGLPGPNLETTNPFSYSRTNTVTDYYRCEADLRAGRIATFGACNRGVGIRFTTAGNPDLKAEESESYSVGLVLQPRFIPERFGEFTITVDRWQIEQDGIVGTLGSTNIAVQDYLERMTGSSNANVIRAAPNADDVALFAGTGLAPVGQITEIRDQFKNLQPQTVSGVDIGLNWLLRTEDYGRFTVNIDATYMDKYSQELAPPIEELFDAREDGTINPATPLTDPGDLLRKNGKPEWKGTGTLTWRKDNVQIGASVLYTGSVLDTDFLAADGTPWTVKSLTTANLYVQYRIEDKLSPLNDTRLRVGARNIFDKDPPLSSGGYIGSLYNPYARYWYLNVSKSF
jgi:iron complex outermembrane receptor protein